LMKSFKIERFELILIAILVLGLFLRTYCLTCESVWLDEGYSIFWAKQEPSQMIDAVSKDVHPPLYFLILHYWINLFGDSEFALRFLSVIFGLLAIIMMYMVGNLLFNKDMGIMGSLILSISVFHIHYSQEIRSYSLMVLLTLVSMYFFLKLLERRSYPISAGYIASSTLLIYTHFFGLFVIAAQNIYLASLFIITRKTTKRGFRRWIILQAILFVLYLPWLGFLIRQALIIQGGEFLGWLAQPSILLMASSFFEYSGYFNVAAPLWVLFLSAALSIIFIILSLNSILKIKKSGRGKILFLVIWLLTPTLLPFMISQFSAPIYFTKFTIPASLAFYLLVAKGILNIRDEKLRAASTGMIVILSLVSIWGYISVVDNEQWREAVDYIETNAEQGDLALINAWYCHIPFDYYFTRSDLVTTDLFPKWDYEVNEDNIKNLEPAVTDYGRVWLLLSHGGDPSGLIKKTLTENLSYEISLYKQYYNIELYLFEKL
jgi:mannosyltransferase